MIHRSSYTITIAIALVWLINGLYCKILNSVPRHQQIVGEILGTNNARLFTTLIGIAEIVTAVWILSKIKFRFNGVVQIAVILSMNCMEFLLVPHLLLWGKWNIIFAVVLCAIIYWHQVYKPKNN